MLNIVPDLPVPMLSPWPRRPCGSGQTWSPVTLPQKISIFRGTSCFGEGVKVSGHVGGLDRADPLENLLRL
jgi:hypothetical protein